VTAGRDRHRGREPPERPHHGGPALPPDTTAQEHPGAVRGGHEDDAHQRGAEHDLAQGQGIRAGEASAGRWMAYWMLSDAKQ